MALSTNRTLSGVLGAIGNTRLNPPAPGQRSDPGITSWVGADLRLVPAKPYKDFGNYVHVSQRLAHELGAVWANQFGNLANR